MELALAIPALLLLVLAFVEVAVVARTQLQLIHAAREGARVAATVPDSVRAVDAARRALPEGLAEHVRVSVKRPAVVGEPAEVVLTHRHRIAGGLLAGLAVDVSARSVMRVER